MEAPNSLDKLRIYFGATLKIKIRNGREGAPVLCKIHDEPRQLLTGQEAVAFLEYLASNDLRNLWHKLPEPADTLRARCDTALKTYRMIR